MPADHGFGLYDDQSALPARPEARERDPERAIERGESRSRVPLRVDGELLPQGQLHDGLLLSAPEESEQGAKGGDREGGQCAHGGLDSGRVERANEG